jgi:hypothetical protein
VREGSFHWPGVLGLVVTATAADGRFAGVAAPVGIYERVENLTIWDELPRGWGKEAGKHVTQGAVKAAIVDDPETAHSGQHAMRIATSGGPWSLRLFSAEGNSNLCSYDALSIWVRAEQNITNELYVQLEDSPLLLDPAATARLPVLAGGYVQGGSLGTDYRQVIIPAARFLKDAGSFRPALCHAVIFSGAGQAPATYWIDNVQLGQFDELENAITKTDNRSKRSK